MNTNPTRSRRPLGPAMLTAVALAAGGVALAFADGPLPDPPVPPEAPLVIASADAPNGLCGALRARDLESQVDRHVEQWQALHASHDAKPQRGLHPGNLVEGVVGYPVRHFRLAADDDPAGVH
jgi:hypothetical protein